MGGGKKQSVPVPAPGDTFVYPVAEGVLGAFRVLRTGNPFTPHKQSQVLWMASAWFGTEPPPLDEPELVRIIDYTHPPNHLPVPEAVEKLVGKPRGLVWCGPPPAELRPIGNIPVSPEQAELLTNSYGLWEVVLRSLRLQYAFQQDPEGEIARWTALYRSGTGAAPGGPGGSPEREGGPAVVVDGVSVEIDLEGDEDLLNQLVERLPDLVRAARAAVTSGEHEAAALYARHHLAELTADDWECLGQEPPGSEEELLARLVPVSVWGDPDDGVTLDLSIGAEVTDYVLGVTFDAEWAVADVALES
jgi:hypothetical protein